MAVAATRHKLRRTASEAKRARLHVRAFCRDLPVDVSTTAELLASELVTNAIKHGEGRIELVLATNAHSLDVQVMDESPQDPHLVPGQPEWSHGRGIMVVDAFAADWGVAPRADGPGKSVWFTLPTAG